MPTFVFYNGEIVRDKLFKIKSKHMGTYEISTTIREVYILS